jgi:hypothetical protein
MFQRRNWIKKERTEQESEPLDITKFSFESMNFKPPSELLLRINSPGV